LCFAGIRRGLGSLLRRRELRLRGLERGPGERGVGGAAGKKVCGTSFRVLRCYRCRLRLIVVGKDVRRKNIQSISICTQVVIQEATTKPSRTGNERSGRLAGRTDTSSGLYQHLPPYIQTTPPGQTIQRLLTTPSNLPYTIPHNAYSPQGPPNQPWRLTNSPQNQHTYHSDQHLRAPKTYTAPPMATSIRSGSGGCRCM
jgi:hypothetical protein